MFSLQSKTKISPIKKEKLKLRSSRILIPSILFLVILGSAILLPLNTSKSVEEQLQNNAERNLYQKEYSEEEYLSNIKTTEYPEQLFFREITSHNDPQFTTPKQVEIVGDLLYISVLTGYFYVINISNKWNPEIVAQLDYTVNRFFVRDNVVFTISGSFFTAWNFSILSEPTFYDFYDFSLSNPGISIEAFIVTDTTAVISDPSYFKVVCLNITDLTNLSLLSNIAAESGFYPTGMELYNETVYLSSFDGFYAFNISNPNSVTETKISSEYYINFGIHQNKLYCNKHLASASELQIFNLSNPSVPLLESANVLYSDNYCWDFIDDYLFVIDDSKTLRYFNISDSLNPVEIHNQTFIDDYTITEMNIQDNYLFIWTVYSEMELCIFGIDSDLDLLADEFEEVLGTDPARNDTDGDILSDGMEYRILYTNPLLNDTDGDLLGDGLEFYSYKTNPVSADTDSDYLDDYEELFVYLTDPINSDTDSDGLSDGLEIVVALSNPLVTDTDGDGLLDGEEYYTYQTDPTNADTDGDGYSDKEEVDNNTNPLDPQDNTKANNRKLIVYILMPIILVTAAVFFTSFAVLARRRTIRLLEEKKKPVVKLTVNWFLFRLFTPISRYLNEAVTITECASRIVSFLAKNEESNYQELAPKIFRAIGESFDEKIIKLTLKILGTPFNFTLTQLEPEDLQFADRTFCEITKEIASGDSSKSKKQKQQKIDQDNFTFPLILEKTSKDLLELKFFAEVYSKIEAQEEISPGLALLIEDFVDVELDSAAAKVYSTLWKEKVLEKKRQITLFNLSKFLDFGIITTFYLVTKINDYISSHSFDQTTTQGASQLGQEVTMGYTVSAATVQETFTEEEELIDSYASELQKLWQKREINNYQNIGAVIDHFKLDSFTLALEIINYATQKMMLEDLNQFLELSAECESPLLKIPILVSSEEDRDSNRLFRKSYLEIENAFKLLLQLFKKHPKKNSGTTEESDPRKETNKE